MLQHGNTLAGYRCQAWRCMAPAHEEQVDLQHRLHEWARVAARVHDERVLDD